MNKSIIGSCDCLTKTPDYTFHNEYCKYRLIIEKDEAIETKKMALETLSEIKNKYGLEERNVGKEKDELINSIFQMAKTCASNKNYSRVDLAETMIRKINEHKSK